MSRACGSSVQCEVRDAPVRSNLEPPPRPTRCVTSVTPQRGRAVKFSIFDLDCQWGLSPDGRHARARLAKALLGELRVSKAVDQMIIHESGRLHEGVTDR